MDSPKTYLITGATGLIGSYIARKLLEKGQKVLALKRKNSHLGLLGEVAQQITWVEGDILDIGSLDDAVAQADRVVHAAAFISFRKKHARTLLKINVEGTANVVNTCLKYSTSRLCYISSIAALGQNHEPNTLISENTHYDTENRASQYGYSKYLAEQEVWRGVAEGLEAFVLNPSVVLGVGDWNKSSLVLFKVAHQNIGFYPKGSLNMVDVRDIAQIVWQLFETPELGNKRYILNAHHLSYSDFLTETALRFGKKKPSIALGNLSLKGFYWLSQVLISLRLMPPVITKETIEAVQRNIGYDNSLIINKLGFQYRSFAETLDWTCENFLKTTQ